MALLTLPALRHVRRRVRLLHPAPAAAHAARRGRHRVGRIPFTTEGGLPGHVQVTADGGTVWLTDPAGGPDRYAGQITATRHGYSATSFPALHRSTWREAARDAAHAALAHRTDDAVIGYRDAYRAKIELIRAAGHPAMTSEWTRRDDAEAVALRLADEVLRTGQTLSAALHNPASTIGYVNELRVRLARAERGLVHAARYAAGLPPLPADAPHVPAPRDGSCVLGCATL